jgi:hypothetical protein
MNDERPGSLVVVVLALVLLVLAVALSWAQDAAPPTPTPDPETDAPPPAPPPPGEIAGAAALPYGTYALPFRGDAIWNRRIAQTAQYRPAGFSAERQRNFLPGAVGVHQVRPTDPTRKVYRATGAHFSTTCSGQDRSTEYYAVGLPNDLVVEEPLDNGFHLFVFPDGTVRGGMGWERCQPKGTAAQFFRGEARGYRIDGDGLTEPTLGLGAAQLAGLGGILRKGELTTSAGIAHALRLQLTHPVLSCARDDPTPGYRWPAKAADSGACTPDSPRQYEGDNSDVEMGSLLALPPWVDCTALRTPPGKKLCRALKTYGAYVADSCCNTQTARENFWMLAWEIHTPTDRTVEKELRNAYGIDARALKGDASGENTATRQFKADLDALYTNLHVITNTSPDTPKG